jgi:glycosyltransferase involved in cell wall biosynthesis
MVGHGQAGDRHTETWMEAARKTGDRWAVVHACGLPTVPIEHRDRAEVLENGYDPSRVESTLTRQEARARLGLDPGVFAIGFIGRLASEKRPELLTGAIRHLDRRRFRLVVAGDGPARLGDYGQTDRVLRLGWRDDVADILAALDCLASPSEVEGFGLSMVEAMAAGVPVVGTPRGVLATRPELARIVPVEDGPAEWARALAYERLEAGPRAERAEKARGVARRTWSPEAFGRRWSRFLWRAARVHPDAETAMDLAARRERNQALGGGCGCHGKAVTVTAAPVP